MRLLHTSDWHLGVSLRSASRDEDHALFLDWLVDVAVREEVDAILVAGDVFDTFQPSAEAQRLYYGFLRRVSETAVSTVVVVGGNHDSPSRLDAPEEVLRELNVHVVGGIKADPASWERCVVPLRGRSGEVEAVCLAVPYVHEFRLGIRTAELDAAELAGEFARAFSGLYTALADRAEAAFPGTPIVATGHLTMFGSDPGLAPQPIHQVGRVNGLPDTIFDERIRYVALGHIHAAASFGPRIAYCGSPIPLSRKEMGRRQVNLVDLGEEARPRPLFVPAFRRIEVVAGREAEVVSKIRRLAWEEPLPPLLYVEVDVDQPGGGVAQRVHEALDAHPVARRPRIVGLSERGPGRADDDGAVELGSLADLDPVDVFLALCRARDVQPTDALLAAFRDLMSEGA